MDRASRGQASAAGLRPFAWATLILIAGAIAAYLYNT